MLFVSYLQELFGSVFIGVRPDYLHPFDLYTYVYAHLIPAAETYSTISAVFKLRVGASTSSLACLSIHLWKKSFLKDKEEC